MSSDMHGNEVRKGDRIQPPGYPMFAVEVLGLATCEDGCPNGAAAVIDPESGQPDEVCLGSMEVVRS